MIGINCGEHYLWKVAQLLFRTTKGFLSQVWKYIIHHLHCIEEKQPSFIIKVESLDVCLIICRKKCPNILFNHKYWALFQLTDFLHKYWTCKDMQVKPTTAAKAPQSLFAYYFVTQYRLTYLILIVFDQSRWQREVHEDWTKGNITPVF